MKEESKKCIDFHTLERPSMNAVRSHPLSANHRVIRLTTSYLGCFAEW